jgi:hypothetical protein
MVPSISFSGRECRHADKIFAFPARTEFSVTTGGAAAIGAVCGAALQTGRRAGGASMAGIRQWFMADFKADI